MARPRPTGLPVLVTAVTLAGAGGALAEGVPGFFDAAWRGFDTGYFPDTNSPTSIAVADLDGDGDIDVVAGRQYFWLPGITVMMNHGDGTFAAPVHYATVYEDTIGQVKIADMDLDGDPDVVATIPGNWGSDRRVALWPNNGDGTFGTRREYTVLDEGPSGLVIDDFNADGFPDVATGNGDKWSSTTVTLLTHNGVAGEGAGFVYPPVTFEVGAMPRRIASADLDGDGLPDLAVANGRNPTSHVQILINDAGGGFVAKTSETFQVPDYAEPFVGLEDLDNDGDADLVTGSYSYTYGSGMLFIKRNNGDATFGALESYQLAHAEWPRGLDFADVNGDGFTDILCAHPNGRRGESWTVLPSDGNGGFRAAERYPSSQNSHGVAGADVDGDGDVDVLSLAQFSNALTVHENDGAGQFPRLRGYEVEGDTQGIDAGDIDLDGDLDLVTMGGNVRIIRNNGDGTFETPEPFPWPQDGRDIKLRDLDGDGYVDILVGPEGVNPPYHFSTGMNFGNGTFDRGVIWGINACGPGDVDAWDLDNDGDLDVVLAEELACQGQYSGYFFIARNAGDGTFDQLFLAELPMLCKGLNAYDFNHDGHLDLITKQADKLGVLLGNGDLSFQEALLSGGSFNSFDLTDVNNDGEMDVVAVAGGNTNMAGFCLGNGDGTFQDPWLIEASSTLEPLAVGVDVDAADVDLDGDNDFIVTNYASSDISLFINNGDSTFQPQQRYGPGINPHECVFGDFDLDGTPDIATFVYANAGGRFMTILRGTTDASVTGDANGDGVVDFGDVLAVLSAWGVCEGACPEDQDGNGIVDFSDLLIVLANWS